MTKLNWKAIIPHGVAFAVFLLLSSAYFIPQFSGKVVNQNDITALRATSKEYVDHKEKTGTETYWTNSLFSGMPTYQISQDVSSNLLLQVRNAMMLWLKAPAGMFVLGMLGFYILMMVLGVNHWLAIVGSVLFAFGSNHMVLFEAGHNTKILALMTSAPVVAGVILTYRGHLIKGGLLFAMALGINLLNNHPQMTYYLAMALAPLVIVYLIDAIKNKTIANFTKASGALLLGAALALGSSANKILPTLEYQADTMRGKPVLEVTSNTAASSSETEGLAWDYAMNWSNGLGDLLVSWIPDAVGGATVREVSKDSAFGKVVGARDEVQTYTYFGGLPSTAGPVYYGAVLCFLFFISFFTARSTVGWWSLVAVLFTFMVSLGSNLEWFNRLLFDHLPIFNKFRAHSSITGITGIIVALGGIYGLSQVMKLEDKTKVIKPFLIGSGLFAGLTLIVAMIGPSISDLTGTYDARLSQDPRILDALQETRADMLKYSALRSLLFILGGAALIYLYLKGKIKEGILIGGLAILGLMDLIPVSKDYLSADDFVSKRKQTASFELRPVDKQILADTDPHYRVFDTQQFDSAMPSYHHKHIGGYHPAKLQRYEDFKNRYLISATGQNNIDLEMVNMLNTKYLITYDGSGNANVQRNPEAMGNAWFVGNTRIVQNANEELGSLKDLDPSKTAVIHKEFESYASGLSADSLANIKLTSYAPNKLVYNATTSVDQLAVFSEVWYGPDKGWNAYIDGQLVPHVRANYILRALKIPSGNHEIIFAFEPASVKLGKLISMICSAMILLGGLFVGYREIKGHA